MSRLERIGVAGCGLMGSGIAELMARSGLDTLVFDVDEPAVTAGRQRLERSVTRAVDSGKLSDAAREETLSRLRFTTDLSDLADRLLVVEAIIEDERAKAELFTQLDKVVTDPSAILASNTSSIPIMKLAMATSRP